MVREHEMTAAVDSFFKNRDFSVYREVHLKTKRIDYLCVSRDSKEIVAVELKVRDWKKAFHQAIGCTLFADRVFVALWHEYITRVNQDPFERYGIGLLKVSNSVEVLKEAEKRSAIQPSLRRLIESYIFDGRGEDKI